MHVINYTKNHLNSNDVLTIQFLYRHFLIIFAFKKNSGPIRFET